MAKRPIVLQRFDGGMSSDNKIGPANSFSYSRHIDFRKSPTQLTVLPETVKESANTVTGLVVDMIQLPSGKLVAVDTSGGVYSRATNGTWTKDGTTLSNTAYSLIYNLQNDIIYIPGTSNIHSITNADGRFSGGTFTVNDNYMVYNVDQSAIVSSATYTTTNNITETATHMLVVTPTVEPLQAIRLWVTTKGTGDVVVTMHDAANNILGTVTKTAAQLTNGALNIWTFSAPVRTTVSPNGATYHFHVTHPSGTATTVGTSTASDFSTARYETYVNRLLTTVNGFHPSIDFLQYLCIGNGRYLSVWEVISQSAPLNTEYLRHRLTFPQGYEVCGLAVYTEYLAIACEKRSSSAGNEFQDGKIFFWDGTSQTYNFLLDVPEGSPYGLYSKNNIVHYFAGGSWYAWSGGNPVKIRQMPSSDTEYGTVDSYTVNYPNTMAVRNGILLAGYPSETNSTTVEHGVYSFGARDRNYNESFGLSYTMSTGALTNGTLRIGCVKNFGDKLFIGWRDSLTYGIDIVQPTSEPFSTAVWESLILDDGKPYTEKEVAEIFIDFVPLPVGCTITPKYKINRGSWVTGTASVATATQCRMNINKRYKELMVGFDVVCTTASPTIYGITIIRDLLESEKD